MLKGKTSIATARGVARVNAPNEAGAGSARVRDAFVASLACVLVDAPVIHPFAGAIDRSMAETIWVWIERDVAPSEAGRVRDAIASGADPVAAVDLVMPEVLTRLKAVLASETQDREIERRNTIQMGGEEARQRLPYVIVAMRKRAMLEQAAEFGRALGNLQDEVALGTALETVNISNVATRALWMQAMVSRMVNPSRVMGAAVKVAGGPGEIAITNAGYAPLVDAMLAHAQNQLATLVNQPGLFADVDMACKAIDRFHRLMRAINYNLEIGRKSAWGLIISDLVGRVSERLDRPLREVSANVTQALRKPRDGADRVDADKVLGALNGLYLLTTVRHSRDSLAVNALLDQVWSETGQAVEVLVTRAMETYRTDPHNVVLRDRLDAGIKMAEIRFNADYAEILRRARDGVAQRTAPQAQAQ